MRHKPRVVMLVNNPGSNDNRVVRSVNVLKQHNYECHVAGIMKNEFTAFEEILGVNYHRIPLYSGPRLLIYAVVSSLMSGAFLIFFEKQYFRYLSLSGKKTIIKKNNENRLLFFRKLNKYRKIFIVLLITTHDKINNLRLYSEKLLRLEVVNPVKIFIGYVSAILWFLYLLIIFLPIKFVFLISRSIAKSFLTLSRFVYKNVLTSIKKSVISFSRKSPFLNKINAIKLQTQFSFSLFRKAVELKADIYHCHDLWTLQAGVIAAKINHSKLVYDSHEIEIERNTPLWSEIQKKEWAKYEMKYIHIPDEVITVSQGCANYIASHYALNKVHVIRNIPLNDRMDTKKTIRRALGLDKNRPLIVYIGSVTFGRGLEVILQSLVYLRDYVFCTLGPVNRSYEPVYFGEISSLELYDRVFSLKPVPAAELISYIRDSDVSLSLIHNVCLSYYYSLPNKIFESINAFVPVLCSDFPDMKNIIKKYNAGEYCQPDDAKLVAENIKKVYRNKSSYYQPNAIKKAIRNDLNFKQEGNKLLLIYKSLI